MSGLLTIQEFGEWDLLFRDLVSRLFTIQGFGE